MLEGHTNSVLAVAISTDGGKIVSGSEDNTMRVWNAETGEVIACLPAFLHAYMMRESVTTCRSVSYACVWVGAQGA